VSTTEKLIERKSNGSGLEHRGYGVEIRHADHVTPLSAEVGTNFVDNRRLSRGLRFGNLWEDPMEGSDTPIHSFIYK
jgi:hypothetical protein